MIRPLCQTYHDHNDHHGSKATGGNHGHCHAVYVSVNVLKCSRKETFILKKELQVQGTKRLKRFKGSSTNETKRSMERRKYWARAKGNVNAALSMP